MKFVSKQAWGSNESKEATADSHPIGSTKGVTLHWVGPGMGYPWDHATCDDKVRGIERHHEYGNGWGDIAYNLLVCPHGYVFEGRGAGVRSAANGGTQSNADWYAVCYLGGLGDGFGLAGDQGMRDAVAYLRRAGSAGPRVNGHRDHKGTDCPGDTIYRWLRATDFTTDTRPDPEDDMYTDEDRARDKRIHDRLFGVTHQRFIANDDGRVPAKLLDQRDGDYIVRQIVAGHVDVDALAAAIVAQMPEGEGSEPDPDLRATVKAGVLDALRAGTEE